MEIRDEELNVQVDVASEHCPNRGCYLPQACEGVFTQGRRRRPRGSDPSIEYICKNRYIWGCPDKYDVEEW